ncbi:GNAT family N-acetyltransferase [Candidatus Poribacteria bacterium]|nr:GNAT family N-acetyltransferase [Candidatus Poribacteria bacterium]
MPDIRAFAPEDADEALRLWSTIEGLGTGPGDNPEALGRYLARNPGLSLVAVTGGRIIATILCGHDGRRGYLYHLAVAPEHRRRGLAGELTRRCLEALRELGIERCQVFVMAENTNALRFWERMGGRLRSELKMFSLRIG